MFTDWVKDRTELLGMDFPRFCRNVQIKKSYMLLFRRVEIFVYDERKAHGKGDFKLILSPLAVEYFLKILDKINLHLDKKMTLYDYFGVPVLVKEIDDERKEKV